MKKTLITAAILITTATAFAANSVPTDEERARWTHSDMNNWRIVMDAYKTDYDKFPAAADLQTVRPLLEPVYIRTLPVRDAWGNGYRFSSTEETYTLTSAGRDGKLDTADDIVCTPKK